ncbi:hypothetical protein I0Q91_11590 [Halanaerobiaceae bacterium Z-7014]|uniref:Bacterial transcriptional activator domain-containing protein n=1 Tax=Halonatronomonas betaini TaxID=2778430 RepID=A0A931F9M2_9FIRM|nr:BTAD domain-containing putative transcriptional regulator [Halonatronomonas betaini]MBF8437728.1 hypothetical protein [Halonatronomonas betaini]
MEGDPNLKVYTLGEFVVKKDNNILTDETNYSNKLWELFQYFLSHPNKIQPMETIIDDLNFDLEMLDAKNALENRVYRLRKLLSKGEEYKSGKYIIFKHGGYSLNWQGNYWCDMLEFKNKCRKGEDKAVNGDKEAALSEYLPALDLYKGDYLNNGTNKHWVIPSRIQYKQIYLDSLNRASHILEEFEEYNKIETLCREAIQHEPFEERPHYLLLTSLIKQGYKREAKIHYEFVKSLFADQVSEPFPELYKKINGNSGKSISTNDQLNDYKAVSNIYEIDSIKEKLSLSGKISDKKFISADICCDFADFLVKNQQRYNGSLYMASIALDLSQSDIDENKKDYYIDKLKNAILKSLRSSDVICKWTDQQFVVFFPSIQEDTVREILGRLKNYYYIQRETTGTALNTNYRKL